MQRNLSSDLQSVQAERFIRLKYLYSMIYWLSAHLPLSLIMPVMVIPLSPAFSQSLHVLGYRSSAASAALPLLMHDITCQHCYWLRSTVMSQDGGKGGAATEGDRYTRRSMESRDGVITATFLHHFSGSCCE